MSRVEIRVEHWEGEDIPKDRVRESFQSLLQMQVNNGWTIRSTVPAPEVDSRLQGVFIVLAKKVKSQKRYDPHNPSTHDHENCNCWPCRSARGAKDPV